ncbi:hypothetical protein EDF46_3432 [Frondihabitans sp. PhB188]|uniref:hypothetical protein n=1 Tax=Frondihabitans sp. PhB188 TaxID=2485200 RepID=UPI000F47A06B|nr:hypothetical protein [Frondihabitans sp. PhB188]ROQ30920.1 hypothetical protein EDF46_3432 [Frondihabitans sp. PhB188]
MTLTAPSPFTFTTLSAAPTWTQVAPTLWSAVQGTEFHGTVEYADYRFTACDQVGSVIGTFDTLDDAQTQVLHPTGRAYLNQRVGTLFPRLHITPAGRFTALAAGIAATTAAAMSLMTGALHS